jgi:hypothetical protein
MMFYSVSGTPDPGVPCPAAEAGHRLRGNQEDHEESLQGTVWHVLFCFILFIILISFHGVEQNCWSCTKSNVGTYRIL